MTELKNFVGVPQTCGETDVPASVLVRDTPVPQSGIPKSQSRGTPMPQS